MLSKIRSTYKPKKKFYKTRKNIVSKLLKYKKSAKKLKKVTKKSNNKTKKLKVNKLKKGGTKDRPKRDTSKYNKTEKENQKRIEMLEELAEKLRKEKLAASKKKREEVAAAKRAESSKHGESSKDAERSSQQSDYYRRLFIERAQRIAKMRKGRTPQEALDSSRIQEIFKRIHNLPKNNVIYDLVTSSFYAKRHSLPRGTTNQQLVNDIKIHLRKSEWKDEIDKPYFNDYLLFLLEQYEENKSLPRDVNSKEADEALAEFDLEEFLDYYAGIMPHVSEEEAEKALAEYELEEYLDENGIDISDVSEEEAELALAEFLRIKESQ